MTCNSGQLSATKRNTKRKKAVEVPTNTLDGYFEASKWPQAKAIEPTNTTSAGTNSLSKDNSASLGAPGSTISASVEAAAIAPGDEPHHQTQGSGVVTSGDHGPLQLNTKAKGKARGDERSETSSSSSLDHIPCSPADFSTDNGNISTPNVEMQLTPETTHIAAKRRQRSQVGHEPHEDGHKASRQARRCLGRGHPPTMGRVSSHLDASALTRARVSKGLVVPKSSGSLNHEHQPWAPFRHESPVGAVSTTELALALALDAGRCNHSKDVARKHLPSIDGSLRLRYAI
ncbi:hypothetical protein BKA70DRAFT_1500677 [Coprinopsis sp. MPI-PUGE-AT-0042]|nr:hypothetical protein BKA70DRAFT_1500677 [Coprinopsis sp. MPI-PUGE-AT-0042]